MRQKIFFALVSVVLIGLAFLLRPVPSMIFWLLPAEIFALSLLFFEDDETLFKSPLDNVLIFVMFLLGIGALTETTQEFYWRFVSGVFLALAILYEKHTLLVRGGQLFLKTSYFPFLMFTVLVLMQGVPWLGAQVTLILTLCALLLINLSEIFFIARIGKNQFAPSALRALRFGLVSLFTLYYTNTFLPEVFRQTEFKELKLVLPLLALVGGLISLFAKSRFFKAVLFSSALSLLLFWSGLESESSRVIAAVFGIPAAVWSLMSMPSYFLTEQTRKSQILYAMAWAMPGSFLFFVIITLINGAVKAGGGLSAGLWLGAFGLYWFSSVTSLEELVITEKRSKDISLSMEALLFINFVIGIVFFIMIPFIDLEQIINGLI